jgi:hypothetical protein
MPLHFDDDVIINKKLRLESQLPSKPQALQVLNLSDITPKFCTVAMFVIFELEKHFM